MKAILVTCTYETPIILVGSIHGLRISYKMTKFTLDLQNSIEETHALLVYVDFWSGPGCSKLTTSLVNETLKFQTLF